MSDTLDRFAAHRRPAAPHAASLTRVLSALAVRLALQAHRRLWPCPQPLQRDEVAADKAFPIFIALDSTNGSTSLLEPQFQSPPMRAGHLLLLHRVHPRHASDRLVQIHRSRAFPRGNQFSFDIGHKNLEFDQELGHIGFAEFIHSVTKVAMHESRLGEALRLPRQSTSRLLGKVGV